MSEVKDYGWDSGDGA